MKIAILGGGGFVGQHLVGQALEHGHEVVRVLPHGGRPVARLAGVRTRRVRGLPCRLRREAAVRGCDAVICLIARNPPYHDRAADPEAAYLRDNCELPLAWAQSAVRAGAGRFIFVSSIKAVAEQAAVPLAESAPAKPQDAYGRSKRAAELALRGGGLPPERLVIVRPPLVYGPQVGGNALLLLRLAASGWPLPLAGATALRSMISVSNLCNALLACATHPGAAGQCFHVADEHDLAIADMLRQLRQAAGLPGRLFRLPGPLLELGAALTGRRDQLARLTQPLRVDGRAIQAALGWKPRQSTHDGLQEMMRWHLAQAPGRATGRARTQATNS